MQITIEKMVTGARGMAKWDDGRNAFVSGVLPGEVVSVGDFVDNRGYVEVKSYEILEQSERRVKPTCPYSGICSRKKL